MEEWKEINGFETYQVSNLGRVKNCHGKILKPLLNGARENNLYHSVRIEYLGNKKTLKIHRLVLKAFVGEPEEGQIACHKNGDKTDNRLENLYWGTYSDNAKDAIKHGTFNYAHPGFGEKHHGCKYPDNVVELIRKEYTGMRGEKTKLAKKYGVSHQYVGIIVSNKIRAAG